MRIQTGTCKPTTTWKDIKVGECAMLKDVLYMKVRRHGYTSNMSVNMATGEAGQLNSCSTVTSTPTCVVIEEK